MLANSPSALPDIRKVTLINAPIEKVWNAVATKEGLSVWFMPNDFEPVVGHEFHINAGPFGMSLCKVTVVDPPHRLSFHWAKDWTLTFELKMVDGKTEVTIIHSGWDANMVTEFNQPHTAVRPTMDGGWTGLAEKLRAYLEG